MAGIRWSYEAEQWLREIYDYIAHDNPTAAGKVVSGIYEKAQLLSNFPEIGYKCYFPHYSRTITGILPN